MSRVISKHIFNYPLNGVLDEHIVDNNGNIVEDERKMSMSTVALMLKANQMAIEHQLKSSIEHEFCSIHDPESNSEYTNGVRKSAEETFALKSNHATLTKATEGCIRSKIMVPTTHQGIYDVYVNVYTPKKLERSKNRATVIYAHGGGAVALSAEDFKNWRAHFAIECGVVVFDIEYRQTLQTKDPNNARDFYAVIKHVSENAAELGIDSSKIAISGEGVGGYICFGAMVMLAQNDESSLVKLAMPDIPMVGDLAFSDPMAMTKEERETSFMMRKTWRLIASDMDKQKEDPLLFPGKASDELLAKMPPTIILECEFDMFLTEAGRMANRLRAAGRLLEYVVIPGCKHGSTFNPNFNCFRTAIDVRKLAFKEYLHN